MTHEVEVPPAERVDRETLVFEQPEAVDLPAVATKLSHQLRDALGLNIPVRIVEPGGLPRFEMKARRFVVEC